VYVLHRTNNRFQSQPPSLDCTTLHRLSFFLQDSALWFTTQPFGLPSSNTEADNHTEPKISSQRNPVSLLPSPTLHATSRPSRRLPCSAITPVTKLFSRNFSWSTRMQQQVFPNVKRKGVPPSCASQAKISRCATFRRSLRSRQGSRARAPPSPVHAPRTRCRR
jgi:hypothetical protein